MEEAEFAVNIARRAYAVVRSHVAEVCQQIIVANACGDDQHVRLCAHRLRYEAIGVDPDEYVMGQPRG